MLLSKEEWMNLRALCALRDAGYCWADIARETGHDWRTVKKYLSDDAPSRPPAPARRGSAAKLIDPFTEVVDAWLIKTPRLRATVIHSRLVADYGFGGSYQRTKLYVAGARARLHPDPPEAHRRFEVLPGAQAQVDWSHENDIVGPGGEVPAYGLHMTLSCSRDPFCVFVDSQDLLSFWDAHRLAFAHFGGVPAEIVYDRTKTVVRRHVRRHADVPLHPEALAFAEHYGFAIRLAAPRRPQTKGRVERQVDIVRSGVLAGRDFESHDEMNGAFAAWLPGRRAAVHRTHGQVIAVAAEADRAALRPLPETPYIVTDRHLRKVGKDCLVSFEASAYSLPWRKVPRGRRVEMRVTRAEVGIWSLGGAAERLALHPRAARKGTWVVERSHWDGLPDGQRSALPPCELDADDVTDSTDALAPEWARIPKADTPVAARNLATYDRVGEGR